MRPLALSEALASLALECGSSECRRSLGSTVGFDDPLHAERRAGS
jgi:hypothetical protein